MPYEKLEKLLSDLRIMRAMWTLTFAFNFLLIIGLSVWCWELNGRVRLMEGSKDERLRVDIEALREDLDNVGAYSDTAYHGVRKLQAELVSAGVITSSN